jgi:O-antigen ligase
VDGEPASALPRDENGRAYVVLYDSQSSVTTVPLATDLEPGVHTVEVAAEGGEGQWPLVDWRVGAKVEPDEMLWMLAGLAAASVVLLVLLVRDARRVRWSSLAVTFLRLPSGGQAGLVGGLTASLWAAAALSWGRATPDDIVSMTCFVVSLVILPILASLFALRLDLGLALVALLAPFYLVPESMFYRALSMPEALIGLCCAGRVGLQVATRGEGSLRWRSGISACQRYGSGPSSFTALDLGVALLVLSALASGAAADDTLGALFELRSVFVLPALYYGLLRVAPLDRGARRRIVGAFALGGVGVAAVGLVQYALGQNLVLVEDGLLRLQSVYHSPNSVGLYLGRVWPILAVGAWFEDHRRRRTLSILALFVATLALGLSFSRGALLLALPASVLAMGCLAGGRFRRVSALLLGLAALLLVPALCLPRFANLLDLGRGTTFFRLKLWRSSLSMIGEHPLLGVGPGNFLDAYRTRYVLPTAWEEFNLEHAHNILLGHWTRLGVLGVAAGLALQVAFWRAVTQQRRDPMVVGLVGSMAALLGHGLVDNAVFFPDLALAFFLTLAMVAADRPMRDS